MMNKYPSRVQKKKFYRRTRQAHKSTRGTQEEQKANRHSWTAGTAGRAGPERHRAWPISNDNNLFILERELEY